MPPSDILDGLLTPATPAPQTAQVKAAAFAQQIKTLSKQMLVNFLAERKKIYDSLWNAGTDVPPQLIANALGTAASSLFTRDEALTQLLGAQIASIGEQAGLTADQIAAQIAARLPGVPDAWSVTLNADGTVTIATKA